jgi:polyhydroxybutyrate depolymerase
MIKKTLILLFLSTLLANCNKDGERTTSCPENINAETLMHNNKPREYILHVPSSYDGTVSVPVMLNFHGYGGTASNHMNNADMRTLADSENFILVYPQGTCLDGNPYWNASLPSADNKSPVDDFGFIEALIDELSMNYNIDLERVYACGYSNGAMLSYGLACHKGDLIAAIGSVSGTMLDTDCTTSHPTALINIHGTNDDILPYDGNASYNAVEIAINHWTTFNHTDTTPIINTVNDNRTTIEHYAYRNGDSSVSVEHYKIIGGNHVWFDINYQGANTNQLIWSFVSKYDVNGLR